MKFPWSKKRKPRFGSDQEALDVGDPIESASRWARHILERDFPANQVSSAIMVVESFDADGRSTPFYAASDLTMSPVILRGLLGVAQEMATQSSEQQRIEKIINATVSQLIEHFEDQFGQAPPTREEVKAVAEGLLDGPAKRVTD